MNPGFFYDISTCKSYSAPERRIKRNLAFDADLIVRNPAFEEIGQLLHTLSFHKPKGFYLLDPTTGAVQPVRGNFQPLQHTISRMLQPTSRPDEYWAAIPDLAKNETQVGRYDVKDFSFHPVMTIPHIAFDSMAMWVDEPNGKLLVVFEGQLIRLPLSPPTQSPAK